MRYGVVIERGENNYSAYAPDLPGCAAVGDTLAEVKQQITEAITFHLEGLIKDGLPVPVPSSHVIYATINSFPVPDKKTRKKTA